MSSVDITTIATYVTALEDALLEFMEDNCLSGYVSLLDDIEDWVRVLRRNVPQCECALEPLSRALTAIESDMDNMIDDMDRRGDVAEAYFEDASHRCRALGIYNTEDLQTKCAVVRRALCRGVARVRMRLADRLRHLDGRRFDVRAAMEVPLAELRARVDWHPTMVNADMREPVLKRARLCF